MIDFTHLDCLQTRCSNERLRLIISATTTEKEHIYRRAIVAQIEREIQSEREFLGLNSLPEISDDQLLNELWIEAAK